MGRVWEGYKAWKIRRRIRKMKMCPECGSNKYEYSEDWMTYVCLECRAKW